MAELTAKELEHYYRLEPDETKRAILRFLKDSHADAIVYGARAINARLPEWLEKPTTDWDILTTKDAAKVARNLEKKLDKRYGGDFFVVEPARHPGTFRIKSRVTGQGVADITLKDSAITFTAKDGINYTTLEYQEEIAKEILDDPTQKFRHQKDRDTLNRIKVFRTQSKKRGKRRDGRGGQRYWDGSSVDTSLQQLW